MACAGLHGQGRPLLERQRLQELTLRNPERHAQAYTGKGVRCWSGNDDEAHESRHGAGGQGVISVTSNLLPGLMARLMRSPNQELADSLQPLIAWLFCEPNPIGVNTAMARPRLPCQVVFQPPGEHRGGCRAPTV